MDREYLLAKSKSRIVTSDATVSVLIDAHLRFELPCKQQVSADFIKGVQSVY